MSILRVFPRRTNATPDDDFVRVGMPDLFMPKVNDIHVSVAFTWDIKYGRQLQGAYSEYAPTLLGGPAFENAEGEFEPGMYMKKGYVITSRGCPNRCWFCNVWRKHPMPIELPIKDGWIVQDDNLLSCSENHVRAVFEMLQRQEHPVQFSGGLEAARLKNWHIELLTSIRLQQIFFSYDDPDDWEPFADAISLIRGKIPIYKIRCFILVGYPRDRVVDAQERVNKVLSLGIMPFVQTYVDRTGNRDMSWSSFARKYSRPAISRLLMRTI